MTPPTHQSEPGGEQDQGHGVVLHDQEEVYQQPISLISGSVEEVSLYFLGGDPIPYFRLVPIDPRSSFALQSKTNFIKFSIQPPVTQPSSQRIKINFEE